MGRDLRLVLSATILLAGMTGAAEAGFVNYQSFGTDIQPGTTFDGGGVTVTGSGPLDIQSYGGLGIISSYTLGNGAQLIDGSESARFAFDGGPATGVSFTFVFGSGPDGGFVGTVEGFGTTGNSLGTFFVNLNQTLAGQPVDVSSQFGDAALSAFTFTGGGSFSGLSMGTITYAGGVPEPSSLVLFGTAGVIGAGAWTRRRRA